MASDKIPTLPDEAHKALDAQRWEELRLIGAHRGPDRDAVFGVDRPLQMIFREVIGRMSLAFRVCVPRVLWGFVCARSQAEALAQRVYCWSEPFAGRAFLPGGETVGLCEYPTGEIVRATVIAVRWRAEIRTFTYAVLLSLDHPTAAHEVLQGLPRAAMVAWPAWQSWDNCAWENKNAGVRRSAEWDAEGVQYEAEEEPLHVRQLRVQWMDIHG